MGKRFDDIDDWDKLHIFVTKADIKRGVIGSALDCPVALSMKRRSLKDVSVCLGSTTATVPSGQAMCFILPDKVRAFIQAFDSKRSVKPFRATLKNHHCF